MENTLLLADDEEGIRKVLGIALADSGYDVRTAESGLEALRLFRETRPAIVLTDIKMPGMDGIELLRQIKAERPETEVIMITGHGDMDLAIQALNLDATDFINKPIQRHLLEQAIRRAEERRRLAGEQATEMTLQQTERAAVIVIQGNITAKAEARFQALFQEAMELNKPRVVLHFLESAAVNGAGIAILTQLLLESQKQGRHVVVAELSENLRKVFEIVGLSKLVPVVDSLDKALA